MKRRLREIADARQLTQADKDFVLKACEELGIDKPSNTRCKNCYQDKAIECFKKLNEKNNVSRETKYVLREGVDVWFGDVRVCEATITDELAEDILSRGFNPDYFVK